MPSEGRSVLSYLLFFVLHLFIVYSSALHLSATLVGRWFAWGMPLFHVMSIVSPRDWYLQHLEVMTILPAFLLGYLDIVRWLPRATRRFFVRDEYSPAIFVWIVPVCLLLYKMIAYQSQSSVLYGNSISTIKYFFDIQPVMPTWHNLSTVNPIRTLAQMLFIAPFYAGISYSSGAFVAERRLLVRLFTFEKQEQTEEVDVS